MELRKMAKKKNGHGVRIAKSPTGINGLDEITEGGLPKGRTILICGSAGCGKTILAMEYLLHGANDFNEPGLFVSFEESDTELIQNFEGLGFKLRDLIAKNKLSIDFIKIEKEDVEESGEFDLDGLFIRLDYAIKSLGAKRVVLDTIETLFGGLPNPGIIRSELVRLFRWLKDRGVTAIITGERGEGTLTRHGLEEYVSDCVILLDHRVDDQVSTRRLRVVKYRGTSHGTNEYPFVIDTNGVSVLPVTSMALAHGVSAQKVSTGIESLNSMMSGGIYRGSSTLISGTAGTGKSTFGAHFANSICRAGERCIYFAFEESPEQICRNMQSVGLDLKQWIDRKRLIIDSARPTLLGLEQHLVNMHRKIEEFKPSAVVIDPISNLIGAGSASQAIAMLLRLIDFLKSRGITAYCTSLTHGGEALEGTQMAISSLMDTWILLRDIEIGGERNRGIYILKSRGTKHSNQIREYRLHSGGIEMIDVYTGSEGVLTGTARMAQEERESAAMVLRHLETERRQRELDRKRKALEAKILALQAEYDSEAEDASWVKKQAELREDQIRTNVSNMANRRQAVRKADDKKAKQTKSKGGYDQ